MGDFVLFGNVYELEFHFALEFSYLLYFGVGGYQSFVVNSRFGSYYNLSAFMAAKVSKRRKRGAFPTARAETEQVKTQNEIISHDVILGRIAWFCWFCCTFVFLDFLEFLVGGVVGYGGFGFFGFGWFCFFFWLGGFWSLWFSLFTTFRGLGALGLAGRFNK